jgi:hypothetical protein
MLGPYPLPKPNQYAADCRCGWLGPIVASEAEALKLWHEHRNGAA